MSLISRSAGVLANHNRHTFFFSVAEGVTQTSAYPADLNVRAKLLPNNNLGTFPLNQAAENDLQTRRGYARPYPPGNLQIQGNPYGTRPPTVTGDLTFSWVSRNRLTQTSGGTMILQDAAGIASESGQTFKIIISIPAIGFSRTHTPTTTPPATSPFIYAAGQHALDDPALTNPVTVQLFSNTANGDSYFSQQFTVVMT